jgi:hypothetical protein
MHDCTNVYISEAHSYLNYKMVNNGGNWQLPLMVGGMVSYVENCLVVDYLLNDLLNGYIIM